MTRKTRTSKADVVVHRDAAGEYTGFTLRLPIRPVPASRPRVAGRGAYYTGPYKDYRLAAEKAIPPHQGGPLNCELGATVEFVCYRPKTTKLVSPRGDIDNHLKAIFDAVVGKKNSLKGYIVDDELISHVDARMRYAEPDEEPHTTITIGRL